MRFRVIGHDVSSGQPLEALLDASSTQVARRRAAELGLKADSITSAQPQAPDPVLVRLEPGYVQTIEQTGKTWKALLLASLMLLTLGVGACSWSVMRDPDVIRSPSIVAIVGATLGLAGLVGVLIARVGAWWWHG